MALVLVKTKRTHHNPASVTKEIAELLEGRPGEEFDVPVEIYIGKKVIKAMLCERRDRYSSVAFRSAMNSLLHAFNLEAPASLVDCDDVNIAEELSKATKVVIRYDQKSLPISVPEISIRITESCDFGDEEINITLSSMGKSKFRLVDKDSAKPLTFYLDDLWMWEPR